MPLAETAGCILAHSIIVGGVRWAKGRTLDAADIAAASAAGVTALTVARLDRGDTEEDTAAAAVAAGLAGPGTRALPAAHGRANIAAAAAGVLTLDPRAIDAINAIDEALTVATLAPHTRVATGEIVATVKVIRYAVGKGVLELADTAARPLRVHPFRAPAVAFVATRLPGDSDKAAAKTMRVTRDRVEALGGTLTALPDCNHDAVALAAVLRAATADVLLVAGASATVDRADVIPAAIVAAGGVVERLGMPVDPGNLLCLGRIGANPVIGLPGCARSPKRNGFDWVLERLVAGVPVDSAAIAAMGVGGLLPEAERPQPRAVATAAIGSRHTVGAIVLAAGRSSRMAGEHKLLAEWHDKPLVAHVVDAIAAAGLPPPIVVLGARGDDVRAALGTRAARFVTATDHAEGLSRSLRAGIAAVPADWQAALVCLGDMPRVAPAVLQALARAAAPSVAVLPEYDGKRGNPVAWGRDFFARLRGLDGDVGGKALLAELADRAIAVAVDDDGIFDDIDTAEALAALRLRARRRSSPPA